MKTTNKRKAHRTNADKKLNESSIRNLNLNSIPKSKLPNELSLIKSETDRYYFHWGATAEFMEIIRRRRKSPETLRLVERRLKIPRPGTMPRKFDSTAPRQIWVPSRPNKRSSEEIAEIDGEFSSRANRLGGDMTSRRGTRSPTVGNN